MRKSSSDKELLEQWLAAAEKFCGSKRPDIGAFAAITWDIEFEFTSRWLEQHAADFPPFESPATILRVASRMVDSHYGSVSPFFEVMRRLPSSQVDRILLKSKDQAGRLFSDRLLDQADHFLCQSVDEKLLTMADLGPLEDRLIDTIDRRREQLKRRRQAKPAP